MRSQVQEFCLVGAVFTQQLLTHSCFLPYRNLMLDRRWGGGAGNKRNRGKEAEEEREACSYKWQSQPERESELLTSEGEKTE